MQFLSSFHFILYSYHNCFVFSRPLFIEVFTPRRSASSLEHSIEAVDECVTSSISKANETPLTDMDVGVEGFVVHPEFIAEIVSSSNKVGGDHCSYNRTAMVLALG